MEDIANYAQITTVAVIILIVMQALFFIIATALGVKLYLILRRINSTARMSKEFVADLREQQIKNVSLVRLGMFAFRNIKQFKKRK